MLQFFIMSIRLHFTIIIFCFYINNVSSVHIFDLGGGEQGWNSQFCFWSQRIYNGGRICYISYVFMVPY